MFHEYIFIPQHCTRREMLIQFGGKVKATYLKSKSEGCSLMMKTRGVIGRGETELYIRGGGPPE